MYTEDEIKAMPIGTTFRMGSTRYPGNQFWVFEKYREATPYARNTWKCIDSHNPSIIGATHFRDSHINNYANGRGTYSSYINPEFGTAKSLIDALENYA